MAKMIKYLFPVLIVLISPFFLWSQSGGSFRNPGQQLVAVVNPPSTGRIITVGGRLTPVRKIEHTIPVDGVVEKIFVTKGMRISRGTDLIRIVRDKIGETYRPVILESRLDGIISEIHIYEQEEVDTGSFAITILDDRSFILKASISDRDAEAVRALGTIPVEGRTPDGSSYRGKILLVSTEPDYDTGLFTIDMEFPHSGDLNLGKVLFVDFPAEAAPGLLVEETAIVLNDNKFYLWVLSNTNTLIKREVIPAERIESSVIIEQGISPGERYLRMVSGEEEEDMKLTDLMNKLKENGSAPEKH